MGPTQMFLTSPTKDAQLGANRAGLIFKSHIQSHAKFSLGSLDVMITVKCLLRITRLITCWSQRMARGKLKRVCPSLLEGWRDE